MNTDRNLSYCLAINEAIHQMMETDPSVFLLGQGVKSPWYVGKTAQGLLERFGPSRVIDTPVSENCITGAAIGASIAGMRTIVVHPRLDFMLYGIDPIVNQAANWHYMFGGRSAVPVVIWGIINRGGEQAAQHSQAFHALFAHIPGLKVVMPSTPADAKGLMIASIKDDNPVIFIDDRWLYNVSGPVPEDIYEISIGKGIVRRKGNDLTVVATSYVAHEVLRAADELSKNNINIEIIDPRSIKPLDKTVILNSIRKTGKLLVVDGGWSDYGFASEVIASACEMAYSSLSRPPTRLTLPNCPAPSSQTIEEIYYIHSKQIIEKIGSIL